jgi:hypothetical protein
MSDKNVFDFSARRKENIEQKKRQFERVIFQEFLGVYSVLDDHGTSFPIAFVDISKDGCQFQVPFSAKAKNQFRPGTDVTLKIFFTKGSFLPAVVKIKHATEYIDKNGDAFWRCGGGFDTSLPSFEALSTFISFIYKYAEFSCLDKGDGKVYFL